MSIPFFVYSPIIICVYFHDIPPVSKRHRMTRSWLHLSKRSIQLLNELVLEKRLQQWASFQLVEFVRRRKGSL
jgi:hypothetical protein